MKLTKQQALQLIQDQGPDGARAKLGAFADDYHFIAGQWEAGTINDAPTEENWTVFAILKTTVEMDSEGLSKSIGGTLVLLSHKNFSNTHGNSHQYDGKDGRVWYLDTD